MTLDLGVLVASQDPDPEIDAVVAEIRSLDSDGKRFSSVIRDTFDQLYDGERTGRWSFDQLFKTERTHMGTLVEINLQREFSFKDGRDLDYQIAGVDVDCKYSMTFGAWQLPPEVVGKIALVVYANDATSAWRAGVVRARPEWLNNGHNRDAKKTLKAENRRHIRWLWPDGAPMARNIFHLLSPEDREAVFSARSVRRAGHDGQARVNELFRRAEGVIVRRAELATVAQQKDPTKRARGNGGAREQLRSEGYLILSGNWSKHRVIAEMLGIPVPVGGEHISVRVHSVSGGESRTVEIAGQLWRRMRPGEVTEIAPVITV